ncbi:hypothetical protein [Ruminococcus flavefaciens]|uniref:Uncharacterized protein n=1 Tax=Ruminococcus flavefaciens 007c TaxID=1341157 RepID=W7UAW8_RUMFL|nr:hypothetical protein [Ruminococcus flavefaciens]EWM52206.1 hypothetical protein RF007C_12710 [Ruminococcus flavefaciens 007c]
MAFVNEILTPEQRNAFSRWDIKIPVLGLGHIIKLTEMLPPFKWTADKDRKMYLISSSCDRDFPDEKLFVFIWNCKSYIVQLNQKFIDDYTVRWSIPERCLIDNAFPYCNEEAFLDDLRDALKVYGAFGDESDLNKKSNTIIDF